MASYGPSPDNPHPMAGFPQVCYLNNVITRPNIEVGDYTYYDDPRGPEHFEAQVLYHFPFIGDRLCIGKFCALAQGIKFIMNGANHAMGGFSTYPFYIFGNGWETQAPPAGSLPYKGDTIVENDVWIGHQATIMPGIHIGNGAIVATQSVVVQDVPDYAIVGGNPAQVIRLRFEPSVIAELLEIAWWNWGIEKITRNLNKILAADVEVLRNCQ